MIWLIVSLVKPIIARDKLVPSDPEIIRTMAELIVVAAKKREPTI